MVNKGKTGCRNKELWLCESSSVERVNTNGGCCASYVLGVKVSGGEIKYENG